MKTKKIILTSLMVALGTAITFTGCKKTTTPSPPADGSTATYQMRMTDSPGDYQEVNVNVIGAEIHYDQEGWVALNVKAGVYNLLKLSNGIDTLIVNSPVPTGVVSEVRLILGTNNNTVKINNQLYALETPSADQSGLKLEVHTTLLKGFVYSITLDFDAGKSVVITGANTYKLKPVIRVITTATSGAIKGTILPVISQPAVLAIMGTDTVFTYANTISGGFLIQGLAAGNYKVMMIPKAPFHDTIFSNINVNVGGITSMGTITIY